MPEEKETGFVAVWFWIFHNNNFNTSICSGDNYFGKKLDKK